MERTITPERALGAVMKEEAQAIIASAVHAGAKNGLTHAARTARTLAASAACPASGPAALVLLGEILDKLANDETA